MESLGFLGKLSWEQVATNTPGKIVIQLTLTYCVGPAENVVNVEPCVTQGSTSTTFSVSPTYFCISYMNYVTQNLEEKMTKFI